MWFLGIDIGTTHIKIIGLSEDGVLLPVKKCRTPILQRDGLTFHDAQDVWQMLVIQLTDYARTAARAHGPLAAISIGTFGQEESVAVNLRGDISTLLLPGGKTTLPPRWITRRKAGWTARSTMPSPVCVHDQTKVRNG